MMLNVSYQLESLSNLIAPRMAHLIGVNIMNYYNVFAFDTPVSLFGAFKLRHYQARMLIDFLTEDGFHTDNITIKEHAPMQLSFLF
jgi:hypothetical protein